MSDASSSQLEFSLESGRTAGDNRTTKTTRNAAREESRM